MNKIPNNQKRTASGIRKNGRSEVHEAAWAAMKERPFVWGTFVWAMFDFAVSTRHEGGSEGLNDKGLVTRDRKTKKDAFYFYKANWSDEPVLYITSRRFSGAHECGDGRENLFQCAGSGIIAQWKFTRQAQRRHEWRVRLEGRDIIAGRKPS